MRDIDQDKSLTREVADFGQALFHSAIENPINGVTQIINHSTGANIPQLEIAGEVKNPSIGAAAGTIAGGVLDYYLLSKMAGPALGNLGGQGMTGAALRAGIVGGVYVGVLNPSDPTSDTFFKDRLTNGLVGAAGFAGMAAGGYYLSSTGKFAVPEMRTLSGSITYGALSGAAGGVAQAEADAILRKHQILPDAGDLIGTTFNMAAFGAAFGALNYGYNKAFSPLKVTELNSESKNPRTGEAEKVNLKLFENSKGEVVRLRAELPSQNSSSHIGWESTKMDNGSWSDVAKYVQNGKWTNGYDSILVPKLTNLTRATDGSVRLETSDGQTRIFKPDGEYQRVPTKPGPEPVKHDPSYSESVREGVKDIYLRSPEGKPTSTAWTQLEAKDGSVKLLSAGNENGAGKIFMQKSGDNTWTLHTKVTPDGHSAPSQYTWKGEVKAIVSNTTNQVTHFEFKPESGGQSFTLPRSLEGIEQASQMLMSGAKFSQFDPNFRYLRTDAKGDIFMKTGLSTVNGAEGKSASEVTVKPGDKISVKFDVGDRYPVWETGNVEWSKSLDGKLQINGTEIKPNMLIELRTLLKISG